MEKGRGKIHQTSEGLSGDGRVQYTNGDPLLPQIALLFLEEFLSGVLSEKRMLFAEICPCSPFFWKISSRLLD